MKSVNTVSGICFSFPKHERRGDVSGISEKRMDALAGNAPPKGKTKLWLLGGVCNWAGNASTKSKRLFAICSPIPTLKAENAPPKGKTKLSIFHVALITGLLFISGCGFHLRGTVDFDLSLVYIQSESADKIAQEVARRLTEEGVQVVPTASAAQAVVYLRNETAARRVLSVSSVSGKLEEFELNFRVEMEVRKPDGTVLMEKRVISLLRDYLFDETAVLAMWAEEEMLRQDLFRDLVAQITRQLQALKLGKIELSQLAFEGLEPQYAIGEQCAVDLVETTSRIAPVDIWLTISAGEELRFVTPPENETQPWQLHQEPQPWQTNVVATQTRHRVFDFAVPANLGGKYVLQAVYTKVGAGLDLDNMALTVRSNIAEGKIIVENE